MTSGEQEYLFPSTSPFPGEVENVAPWSALEVAARLPTQLACFVTAVSETFLADCIVGIPVGLTAAGVGALLPLCRAKGYFARWRIVGTREVFEPVDVLDKSSDAVGALADGLVEQPRPLSFDRIPADSPLLPALRDAIKGKGWLSVRPAEPSPVITLDESWCDPALQFNTGRQSDFRRAARKAERHGVVTFEVLTPSPSEFDAIFEEAVAVELRSWKKAAGTAIGVDELKQEFFKRFLGAACKAALCRIAFMRIDGRAIAMQMALEWADRFWLFKIGYDEEFRDCSPGNLLMLHTIGHAASRQLKSFELLGNTERWISLFWTQEQRACLRLRTYPGNLRGAFAFAVDSGAWLVGRLGRWKR